MKHSHNYLHFFNKKARLVKLLSKHNTIMLKTHLYPFVLAI